MVSLTDTQREVLHARLKSLDEAEAKIAAARKPFDEAIAAIEMVRDGLMEEAGAVEIAGTCETCDRLIFEGEQGFTYEDGPTFCADHAPTWTNMLAMALESKPEDYDEPEDREAAIAHAQAHISDGQGDQRHTWEL